MTRIGSVALLLVATLSGSAAAECAWVLWTETEDFSSGSSLTVFDRNLYETRAACDAALVRWLESRIKNDSKTGVTIVRDAFPASDGHFVRIEIPFRRVTSVFRKDGKARVQQDSYSCLPDTLDPRGPKGK